MNLFSFRSLFLPLFGYIVKWELTLFGGHQEAKMNAKNQNDRAPAPTRYAVRCEKEERVVRELEDDCDKRHYRDF